MTRDEIMALEAGREMDALVARMMGYEVFERYGYHYMATDEDAFKQGMRHGLFMEDFTHPDKMRLCLHLRRYSTNNGDMWEVVRWLIEDGYCPAILYDDNGHWALSLEGWQNVPDGDESQEIATTFLVEAALWADIVPLAICRTALLTEADDD